jgi:hypothetical protein
MATAATPTAAITASWAARCTAASMPLTTYLVSGRRTPGGVRANANRPPNSTSTMRSDRELRKTPPNASVHPQPAAASAKVTPGCSRLRRPNCTVHSSVSDARAGTTMKLGFRTGRARANRDSRRDRRDPG